MKIFHISQLLLTILSCHPHIFFFLFHIILQDIEESCECVPLGILSVVL